jgi:hypothetical protein
MKNKVRLILYQNGVTEIRPFSQGLNGALPLIITDEVTANQVVLRFCRRGYDSSGATYLWTDFDGTVEKLISVREKVEDFINTLPKQALAE